MNGLSQTEISEMEEGGVEKLTTQYPSKNNLLNTAT